MPIVTGVWRDVSLDQLPAGIGARLTFRISCPAITPGGTIIFPTPKRVTLSEAGSFSVELTRTDNLVPVSDDDFADGVWINVYAEWFDGGGQPLPEYSPVLAKIQVPVDGGNFGELVKIVAGFADVYCSPTAVDSGLYAGFQLNTVTGDLFKKVG